MNSEYFSEVAIGHLNGNDYVKQSSRTGRMTSSGRVFYIGAQERVHGVAW